MFHVATHRAKWRHIETFGSVCWLVLVAGLGTHREKRQLPSWGSRGSCGKAKYLEARGDKARIGGSLITFWSIFFRIGSTIKEKHGRVEAV